MGIDHVGILLNVDDIKSESPDKLQQLLNCPHKCCIRWEIYINVNKTKVVFVRRDRIRGTNETYKVNTVTIDLVQQYRYIGILSDEHLKFEACNDICDKSRVRA